MAVECERFAVRKVGEVLRSLGNIEISGVDLIRVDTAGSSYQEGRVKLRVGLELRSPRSSVERSQSLKEKMRIRDTIATALPQAEVRVTDSSEVEPSRGGEIGLQDKASLLYELAGPSEQEVYVLTSRGDVKRLPLGSTIVDFAYHSIGESAHRMKGARVNGKPEVLSYRLRTGDLIDIHTGRRSQPSMDWLEIARTDHAKVQIRRWFDNREARRVER